jgi:hypothetical protein
MIFPPVAAARHIYGPVDCRPLPPRTVLPLYALLSV